ncbi:hypothetical protein niasHT_010971 [Heterodera trifolii]|uniref:Effector protein n=1 Tax=Heterodera trifolii TaxID=157864 RepID=A0ABD2LG01_9BILA
MRTILFLAMVCLVMVVLMEMANSKAVKKDNKKGAVAASPAKGKASPKGGKSPAKGKAAKAQPYKILISCATARPCAFACDRSLQYTGAADRNSLPSYTSTGTNLDTADENDDYQNYYYGTDESSREFDASAEEEDEQYEEEDGAMSGETDDYGIGTGQEYDNLSVEVPPKSVMLD